MKKILVTLGLACASMNAFAQLEVNDGGPLGGARDCNSDDAPCFDVNGEYSDAIAAYFNDRDAAADAATLLGQCALFK